MGFPISVSIFILNRDPDLPLPAGPWFNIKMSHYRYRKSHCVDKTILRPSYLHNGISYTGKTTSLYWIGTQICLCQYASADIYHAVHPKKNAHGSHCVVFGCSLVSTNSSHILQGHFTSSGAITIKHLITLHQIPKFKCFSSRLAVVFAEFNEARCSEEWRCNWSSAARRCSKYIWVINNFIAC